MSPLEKSDYITLEVEVEAHTLQDTRTSSTQCKHWNKGDYTKVREDLEQIYSNTELSDMDTEQTWTKITDIINKEVKAHVPEFRRGQQTKMADTRCKQKIRERYTTWQNYLHNRTAARYQEYKEKRNKATAVLRKSKENAEREIAGNIT